MADRKIYTFTEIIGIVTTKIGALSANITDFNPGSNIRAIIDSFAHFVEFLQLQINIAFEAFTIRGAKGTDLDNRVQDFGIQRKSSVAASGPVTFKRNTAATSTFTISSGTQVSTQPDILGNTINYTLDNTISFPSGAMSVTGQVTCTVTGTTGNVPSGYITNITSSIPGIDTVTNTVAFTDGADAEIDDQLRKRVPLFLNGLKAANESAVKSAALSVDGITVVKVSENTPVAGTNTVYISNQSGVLTPEQIASVSAAVDAASAFGISTVVVTPSVGYVGITFDLTYDSTNYDEDLLLNTLKGNIYKIVQTNPDTMLKLRDVTRVIDAMPGVLDYSNVKINGVSANYSVNDFSVIRMNDALTDIVINTTAG